MQNIPINQIHKGNNDRTVFDQNGLEELAESIKEHGLIQKETNDKKETNPKA